MGFGIKTELLFIFFCASVYLGLSTLSDKLKEFIHGLWGSVILLILVETSKFLLDNIK